MDRKGKILIPGINEAVAPVTEEELGLYDKIDFDLEEYSRDVGAETLLHSCKVGCVRCEASHRALRGGPRGQEPGMLAEIPARACVPEPAYGTDTGKRSIRLGIAVRRFLKMS